MRIHEGTNSIQLEVPTFLCDNSLGDHISEPLPACHHLMVMAGAPGSGKTSLALGLLTTKPPNRQYRKVFKNVVLFMPKHSMGSLKKNVFEKHDKKKIFHSINRESLDRCYDMVQGWAEDEDNTLVLIDDMTADLKDHENLKFLAMMINNRRHLRLSMWFMVQSYVAIPLNLRKLVSHLVMWKPANKKEYQSMFEELLHAPKNEADAVTHYCFQERHDHLFVDVGSGKMYRNFNLLSYNSSDAENAEVPGL